MSPVSGGRERRMLRLDSNATEADFWLVTTWLLSTDLGIGVLGQIDEDLAVKHTVFVQVEELWVSTHFSSFNGCFLRFFLSILMLLLFKLLFPRLGHLFHLKLVLAHLLFGLLEFPLGLGVSTAATTTHREATSFERGLKLGVLILQLSDHLGLGVFVDRGLVLNLLCSISILQSIEGLLVVGVTWSNGSDHDGSRVTSQGVLKHSREG